MYVMHLPAEPDQILLQVQLLQHGRISHFPTTFWAWDATVLSLIRPIKKEPRVNNFISDEFKFLQSHNLSFRSCSKIWAAASSPAQNPESHSSSLALSKALNQSLIGLGRTGTKLSVLQVTYPSSGQPTYLKSAKMSIKLSCPLLWGFMRTSLRGWGGCLALLTRSASSSSKATNGFITVELLKSSNLSMLEPTTLLKSIHKSGVGSLGLLLSRIKSTYVYANSTSESHTVPLKTPYVGLSFLIRGLHLLSGPASGDRSVGILLGRVSLNSLFHDLIYRAEGIECNPSGVICGCLMGRFS